MIGNAAIGLTAAPVHGVVPTPPRFVFQHRPQQLGILVGSKIEHRSHTGQPSIWITRLHPFLGVLFQMMIDGNLEIDLLGVGDA